MTTCLFSLLTAGADKMAQTDPHGWTLTLISVCVVFCALLILYGVYSLSGDIFSGKFKRKPAPKAAGDEQAIAAAIALALSAEGTSDEEIAALAALSLYLGDSIHDIEPGFITIRKNPASAWGNPQFNFRKYTRK